MQEVILFILSFIFILVIYEIFIVSKAKKNEKKKENKCPTEIKYLILKYKFDLKKLNYHKLLHVCAFVSSFDMALIVSISMLVDNYVLQLLIVVVLVIPVILVSYHLVYLCYKKKGLI